ncbi:MAG: ribulokinase [Treponema sp.]|nr:ribulokinase [Treponema sp.]
MGLTRGEYVLGLDYGSDSARAVLIDVVDGSQAGVSVMNYPRWARGLYCDPAANKWRQHPLDYIEVLEGTVRDALAQAGGAASVKGIAIDTTGSTPCAAGKDGVPLVLKAEFAENPAAMFVLWKDHTAIAETAKINELAKNWKGTDYTQYEGGVYSSEWFWSKALRIFSEDAGVKAAAATFLEHCDWMTALLTGAAGSAGVMRSRCAMGHKAMYHASYPGGYPPDEFFSRLDPALVPIRQSLGSETWTSDRPAGTLCAEWAARLGLPEGIPVAVGAFDAHMGAVGGGVKAGWLVKVLGTSTCDMTVAPKPLGAEALVSGICGQVDGSIIPGMIGYEAGQSSFGDVYAWFCRLLEWPLANLLDDSDIEGVDRSTKEKIRAGLSKRIIPALEAAAAKIEPGSTEITALDWFNGRRTPDANQLLTGAVTGLTLGSDAPRVYRALAEATAFGSRAIIERFQKEGVAIEGIIGIGGVAKKSTLVMQMLADVLDRPIQVPKGDQSVALGAAIFAAVAAGIYPDVRTAQEKLCAPVEITYTPNRALVPVYDKLYRRYRELGAFAAKE